MASIQDNKIEDNQHNTSDLLKDQVNIINKIFDENDKITQDIDSKIDKEIDNKLEKMLETVLNNPDKKELFNKIMSLTPNINNINPGSFLIMDECSNDPKIWVKDIPTTQLADTYNIKLQKDSDDDFSEDSEKLEDFKKDEADETDKADEADETDKADETDEAD